MFSITFYVFSLFLSFTDYKYYLVPNNMMKAMFVLMVIFGFLENSLQLSSVVVSFLVVVFFVGLILINRTMTLGGGDIKYIAIVALYFTPLLFAYFLIISGVLQSLQLYFSKSIQKKSQAYMVPAIFLAAVITDVLWVMGLIPIDMR